LSIEEALVAADSLASLTSVELHVELGWGTGEEEQTDGCFSWYQFNHQAVDHSTLRFSKREDGLVEVLWTGTVWDLLEPASLPSTTLTLRALLTDNGELCTTERTDG